MRVGHSIDHVTAIKQPITPTKMAMWKRKCVFIYMTVFKLFPLRRDLLSFSLTPSGSDELSHPPQQSFVSRLCQVLRTKKKKCLHALCELLAALFLCLFLAATTDICWHIHRYRHRHSTGNRSTSTRFLLFAVCTINWRLPDCSELE